MASEQRPFAPSARRRALAHRAGLHAASPLVVGGVACAAAAIALGLAGAATAERAGAWIAAAARGDVSALRARDLLGAVVELAAPVVVAVAIGALLAHVAQTRALWLPRRTTPGAPHLPAGSIERARRAGFELAAACVIGGVTFGWLWLVAPRLARLPVAPLAAAALVASALAAFAIAWVALGAIDALLRHRALAGALRMTAEEKREDDRLAGTDPRWRTYRANLRRPASANELATAVAGASVLVLGDDHAAAVAWDPVRRPIPIRTACGRGARATQLLGLARRHRIAVHRDPALAAALVDDTGPVPERHWPQLAEVIAAVRRRP